MKPWLETWHWCNGIADPPYGPDGSIGDPAARAKLQVAAPDMCRALLAVEWIDVTFFATQGCPSCGCTHFAGHVDCKLDAALTKAGLPDQPSRDAARKEIGI